MFAYCRRPQLENQWNRLNRVLFVIIIVTTFDGTRAESLITSVTDYKAYRTCKECTNAKFPWSVLMQVCDSGTTNSTENPVISSAWFCPQFSVASDLNTGQVMVTVPNNQMSLIKRLKINVQCKVDDQNYIVSVKDNRIECTPKDMKKYEISKQQRIGSSFLSVVFDGDKRLRFDNPSDHYIYTECPKNHCNWRDSDYNYYCEWCNPKFHFCDKRRLSDFKYSGITSDGVTVDEECAVVRITELSLKPKKPNSSHRTLEICILNLHWLVQNPNRKTKNDSGFPITIKVAERDCNVNGLRNIRSITKITCDYALYTNDTGLQEWPVKVIFNTEIKEEVPLTFVKTYFSFNKSTTQPQLTTTSSTQSTFSPSPPSTIPFTTLSSSPLTTLPPTTSSPPPSTTSSSLPPTTSSPPPSTTSSPPPSTSSSPPPSTSSSPPPSTSSSPPPSTSSSPPPSTSSSPPPSTTSSSLPPTTSSPPPSTTSSPPPSTSSSPPPSTSSSPLPPSTPSILSSSSPRMNVTEDDDDSQSVESTKKEAFNDFPKTITASTLSMVFTIGMYVSFIAVLCVALVCLKSPRTYDLLTFHFRQQSTNEIIRPFDDQEHQLLPLCKDVDCTNENANGWGGGCAESVHEAKPVWRNDRSSE